MKRSQLYVYKKLLQQLIINAKTMKLNPQFLFTALKNKKIVEQQVQLIDKQFDPKQIEGYQSYLSDQKAIVDQFIQQNRKKLSNGPTKQLQYQVNLKIEQNRTRKQYQKLFEQLKKLTQQKNSFIQKQYQDINKLKKVTQFPEQLNQFMQSFMQQFIDVIE